MTMSKTRAFAALAWLPAVAVVFSLSTLRSAAPDGPDGDRPSRPAADKQVPDQQLSNKESGDPLAPLPADQLPPKTGVAPDVAKQQFVRDAVFVRVGEVIITSKGEEILPPVQVVDIYLQEYLRRAGFTIVDNSTKARYRIEGEVFSEHYKNLTVQGKIVAYKVRAECSLFVLDRDGNEIESFEIPEVFQENVKSEESAFLQLRRYVVKLLWDRLRTDGKVFSDPEVARNVAALCVAVSPRIGSATSDVPPTTSEAVIARLVARGLPVVPYMLEALTDTRSVLVRSSYPGVNEKNRSELKVFHIADKVLEEIFQKVSRMGLATTAKGRFRVMKGWELEWRRFCPPYRNSPFVYAGAPTKPPGSRENNP